MSLFSLFCILFCAFLSTQALPVPSPAPPALAYIPSWQSDITLVVQDVNQVTITSYIFQMLYSYPTQQMRVNAQQVLFPNGTVGGADFPSTILYTDSTIYTLDPTDPAFCIIDKGNSTIDPSYPFKGNQYVKYEFAPYTDVLSFRYTKVPFPGFGLMDLWVDVSTGAYTYANLTGQGVGMMLLFNNFEVVTDWTVGNGNPLSIPSFILSACVPDGGSSNNIFKQLFGF